MTFTESRAWDEPQKNPKTIETDQIINVQVECRGREQTSFSVLLLWLNTSLRHKAQVCAQFNLVLSHWGSDTAAKVSRIQRGTARAGRCHGARLNNEAGRTVRRRAVGTNVVKKKKNYLIHYTLMDNTPLCRDRHWSNSHLTADTQNSPSTLAPSKSEPLLAQTRK